MTPHLHRALKWTGLALLALVVVAVLVLATLDWNRFRAPIADAVSERTGYRVRIDGDLDVELLSRTPSATVGRVTIDNPEWRERSRLLALDGARVEVRLLPLLVGRVIVERVTIVRPVVDLYMDAQGRANWRTARRPPDPDAPPPKPPDLPLVRRFVVADGKVRVEDLKHRLSVKGTLVAAESARDRDGKPFNLSAQGTLNDEPFRIAVEGGPLVNLDPGEPYTFEARIVAGATQVTTRGTLPEPFDLRQARLEATMSGRDLAQLYFLTGVALPNSRPYRLAAEVRVDGDRIDVPRIEGRVGGSDLGGRATLDLGGKRPRLVARLASRELDLGDLAAPLGVGLGADARGPGPGRAAASPDADRRLLPDLELQVDRVRALDADVRYRAESVRARRVPFEDVELGLTLAGGVLTLDPVAFGFRPGRLSGTVRIDARGDVPATRVDLRVTGLELGKVRLLKPKPGADAEARRANAGRSDDGPDREVGTADDAPVQPPLEGVLQGRVRLESRGASVRRFAANADGTVTFVIPKGEVNQAFAELTGIDVARGLGLLLKDADEQTELRCAVFDFGVERGVAEARTVVVDTDVVRIGGRGTVDLRGERLALAVQGKPKKFSVVRLRTPIRIEGTFAKPDLGVDAGKLAAQGGVAAVLGAVLTPVAAVLAFVDPGLEKDANCGALLAEAKERGAPVRTRVASGEAGAARDGR